MSKRKPAVKRIKQLSAEATTVRQAMVDAIAAISPEKKGKAVIDRQAVLVRLEGTKRIKLRDRFRCFVQCPKRSLDEAKVVDGAYIFPILFLPFKLFEKFLIWGREYDPAGFVGPWCASFPIKRTYALATVSQILEAIEGPDPKKPVFNLDFDIK